MEALTLQTIADYASGTLRHGDPARSVHAINSDSRTLAEGELFLALRGEKFDGHAYVTEVAAAARRGAIVAEDYAPAEPLPHGFALIAVSDPLLGLPTDRARLPAARSTACA